MSDAIMEKADGPATVVSVGPEWEVTHGQSQQPFSAQSQSGGGRSSRFNRRGAKFSVPIASVVDSAKNRFDRIFPASKTYTPLKFRRRAFLAILIGITLTLLALILGLSIGLSQRKKQSGQNLPLPSGAQIYKGDLTYYNPGLGACGITSTDNDMIVAVSHALWDSQSHGSNPNANPLCGRKIRAQRFDSRAGKTVSQDVTVVDRCVGCRPTDLDVSPAVFNRLADPDLGRVHDMSWAWI